MQSTIQNSLSWLWQHIDPLLALLAAIVCTGLSLAGKIESENVTATVLGVLTIVAFILLRERTGRATLTEQITKLSEAIEAPYPDAFLEYGSDERPLLRSAVEEAWLVQETGLLLKHTIFMTWRFP